MTVNGKRKVVIFTESVRTQNYLANLLAELLETVPALLARVDAEAQDLRQPHAPAVRCHQRAFCGTSCV